MVHEIASTRMKDVKSSNVCFEASVNKLFMTVCPESEVCSSCNRAKVLSLLKSLIEPCDAIAIFSLGTVHCTFFVAAIMYCIWANSLLAVTFARVTICVAHRTDCLSMFPVFVLSCTGPLCLYHLFLFLVCMFSLCECAFFVVKTLFAGNQNAHWLRDIC